MRPVGYGAVLVVALGWGACDDDGPLIIPPGPVVCGDGELDEGEMCEDGNTLAGDGCRADCQGVEMCGDWLVDVGEECDDGSTLGGDGCRGCALETCGDGVLSPGDFCYAPRSSFPVAHLQTLPTSPDEPRRSTVVGGDFDGDGWSDLVVVSQLHPSARILSVLLADRRGGFEPAIGVPVLTRDIVAMLAGDWNGDGVADLALIDGSFSGLRILRNGGDGRTWTDAPLTLPARPTDLVEVDLDGDGDLDLVANGGSEGRLTVLLNDGQGGFQEGLAVTLLGTPQVLAAGDWDLDGRADLASIVTGAGVETFRNRGDGTFQVTALDPGASCATDTCSDLVPADLDGDGDLDLVVPHVMRETTGVLFVNDGQGDFAGMSFAAAHFALGVTGDLDGDGIVDLVGVGGAEFEGIIRLSDDGAVRQFIDGADPPGVQVADLDGDGWLDVVTATGDVLVATSWIQLFDNAGDGTGRVRRSDRVEGGDYPTSLAVGDLDADGDLDVVSCEASPGDVRILRNEGAGELVEVARVELNRQGSTELALGDLDGDGDVDLATNTSFLLNDGTGAFTPYFFGFSTFDIEIADLDGDGDQDMVRLTDLDDLAVFYNEGLADFTVQGVELGASGCCWRDLRLADLDLDGDVDAVVLGPGEILVLENDAGSLTLSDLAVTSGFAPVFTLADVVPGGSPEAVVAIDDSEDLSVFALEGFVPVELSPIPAGGFVERVAGADLDGDGDDDLLVAVGQTLRILHNDGGSFTTVASFSTDGPIDDLAAADLDGDGSLDLLASTPIRNTLVLLRSDP